jgi:hypothetical protein
MFILPIVWDILQIMRDRHGSFFVGANRVFARVSYTFRQLVRKS